MMYSRLSSGITARGSGIGLSLVGPTKVKPPKSFLFTESPLRVWNKEHLVDFVVTLNFTSKLETKKIISQIVGVSWVYDQNGDCVSNTIKSCHLISIRLKRF